jgi:uncharacterized protein (TIGR00288 family)
MLERVRKKLGAMRPAAPKSIGFLVDGPNMLRREFDFDLAKVRKQLEEFGTIKIGRVFLNQYAPEKLIEAIINQGFEPIIVTTDDVDAPMAAEAMEVVYNPNIDTIALMTRDADFQAVLLKAKAHGKATIVVGSEPFAAALRNTADHVLMVKVMQ